MFAPNEDSPSIHNLLFARLFNTHAQWVQMTSKGKLGAYDTFPHIELDPTTQICDRSSLERYGESSPCTFSQVFSIPPFPCTSPVATIAARTSPMSAPVK